MKKCSKCGELKVAGEFHRFVHSSDGLKPACKRCNIASANGFAAAHKERSTAVKLAWYWRQSIDYRKDRERRGNARRGRLLPDSYLATCVARQDFPASLVPKQLIDMKREQLNLRRLTKQLKQEITNQLGNEDGN